MIRLFVPVLHDDQRQPEILRKADDQLAQRGQSPPRRSDDDDFVSHNYLILR